MSRRQTSRAQSSVADSSPAPGRSTTAANFPAYEPPSCHLNDAARSALRTMPNSRDTTAYAGCIKESMALLGTSISDMHERFRLQRERLENLQRRREEKGIAEKSADEERLEAHLEEFAAEINEYTMQTESSFRDLIDCRAELEDQDKALEDIYSAASLQATEQISQRTRSSRQQAGVLPEDDDEDEVTTPTVPATSKRDEFRKLRADKRTEFESMAVYQRYALDNDYAGFKKMWHDGAQGEDGPPLADPSRWFGSDGQPVLARVAMYDDLPDAGDGSDDEIAVAREVISLNCPLSLRRFELPYSNRKCKHTFEKSALLSYLPLRGQVQCPQTGCAQTFTRAKFDEDFYLDQAILRRIERSAQTSRTIDDMDDMEDDALESSNLEGDSELAIQSQRSLRREPKDER